MHQGAVTVHYLFQVIWRFIQVIFFELKYSNYLFWRKLFTKINRFIPETIKIDLLVLLNYSYFK